MKGLKGRGCSGAAFVDGGCCPSSRPDIFSPSSAGPFEKPQVGSQTEKGSRPDPGKGREGKEERRKGDFLPKLVECNFR